MWRSIWSREDKFQSIHEALLSKMGNSHVWVPVWAVLIIAGCTHASFAGPGSIPLVPASETAEPGQQRHAAVAGRRGSAHVICHRGAGEFAPENTLEAYRAAFELGADGNEIDIRASRDGTLVCFHDDTVDRMMEADGEVSEYTIEELRSFRFREPGRFADCFIPTLTEVLELHRKHSGLLHLDIKSPNIDHQVADLLGRFDMWDHVAYCNTYNADAVLRDPRLKLCRYKAPGQYEDCGDMFPDVIGNALAQPGDGVIVDDPRAAILALGRKPGRVSAEPVTTRPASLARIKTELPGEEELLRTLRDVAGWDQIPVSRTEKIESARRIRARARAADMLAARKTTSTEVISALEERVRNCSLHTEWTYQGLDGAAALRSLIHLKAQHAVETARTALWRADAAMEPGGRFPGSNPRACANIQVKLAVFPALEKLPGTDTEKLCRDYLALPDEEAQLLSPPLFREAAKTLLTVSPNTATALELMQHRLRVVRGQTILVCLKHSAQPWAHNALERAAPHAMSFIIP